MVYVAYLETTRSCWKFVNNVFTQMQVVSWICKKVAHSQSERNLAQISQNFSHEFLVNSSASKILYKKTATKWEILFIRHQLLYSTWIHFACVLNTSRISFFLEKSCWYHFFNSLLFSKRIKMWYLGINSI